ncbi:MULTISPECIES: molybdopterin-binding protein [unclassified Legionella]|uniref:competence/damage-inducible protein A n=1 Tax=unclassified Legionella TaxID=2622702 RepID=UPI00105469FF|nr:MULTISPECIES: competence/damage-inducible protein A [unclassified Legionella]MDI9817834.1 competence/damage-inducible protein A [Legionella sp. PL877]
MTIAFLATGDEIVHGDTLNTNSHHLAHALSSEGIPLGLQMACSDKESEIHECIQLLASKHDTIIIIGGLGPTSDDRTRFALQRFLNTKLTVFPQAIEHIQTRLHLSAKSLNPGNRQQALFPPGATLLPNPNGTAMGCYYSWQGKAFILLPGPPHECLPMFNHHVLPLLQQKQHSDKLICKWRLFGVAESQIAQELDEALATLDCQTGYRLETPYVEFKVRCKHHLIEQVKQVIEPIVAPLIIAPPEKKASEQLRERILQLQIPVSIVDEATGGLLQTLIQQPGNYHLLKFNLCNEHNDSLHFHLRGLKEYWNQQQGKDRTDLSIEYSKGHEQGTERHEIPYRSALVTHIAAEWLSFRLLHLINQLHQ